MVHIRRSRQFGPAWDEGYQRSPKACKDNGRKNSWTVDEARKFLECSRNEDDPLYPLWVLILVLGLRKGEALGAGRTG
jgi:hypothetical protein